MEEHRILNEIEEISRREIDGDEFLLETAKSINLHFPHYNWVGFYFLKEGKLHVGPYIGKTTPHDIIELDRGICGAAVSQGRTIVVDNVNADPRYLACSLETKSEIVIPITVNGVIIGELDIDSEQLAAFGADDRRMLEQIAEIVGKRLKRNNLKS